ncbi:MAG: MmgE/PrpD family protein, partial [Proteobacteria bacterium]|nr:MmgE/PrpD family protein [Pseudomonadota bacterium]
ADDYTDEAASEPRFDALRAKMEVVEDKRYSAEYHEPDKRSIANAIQIFFKDGSKTEKVEIEYPVGHKRRRAEGFPLIEAKLEEYLKGHYSAAHTAKIIGLFADRKKFETMKLTDFMGAVV